MRIRWSPYFWVCFSMCVGVMGTALVSPLYPLYQQTWSLRPSQITLLYVVYMLGTLGSLLFLGRLTDRLGFMRVLRLGLYLVTLGAVLSALAWDLSSFMLARILVGIASGLITTSASVGMTQLQVARGGSLQRAASMTGLTIAAGFGIGPLLGGIIGQWFPAPLTSSYFPSIVLGILSLHALGKILASPDMPASALPAAESPGTALLLRDCLPRLTLPARPLRYRFLMGGMTAFCTFSVFSLYASLAPSFMQEMLPWHGPIVAGLAVGVILLLSATIQYFVRQMPRRLLALLGMSSLMLCCALLMLNTWLASPVVFALCVIVTAAGHGLSSLAGIAIVNTTASANNRSGLMATYLVIGYVGAIVPLMAMGWFSDHFGITKALILYCSAMIVLGSLMLWGIYRVPVEDTPSQPA